MLKRKNMEKVIHPIDPIYDNNSKILILGSFPSVKSREDKFYYAHPQNQFWQLMADIFEEKIENKIEFLKKHHIALFDVVKSCDIVGSKDSSIKNIVCNDIATIVLNSKIKTVYTNGKKAYELYQKYLKEEVKISAIYLPSTSPINQTIKYEAKKAIWSQIKDNL